MEHSFEDIAIGQRVRVSDGSLRQYQQAGTVMGAGKANDWYVQLDDIDGAEPVGQLLFFGEELELIAGDAELSGPSLAAFDSAR